MQIHDKIESNLFTSTTTHICSECIFVNILPDSWLALTTDKGPRGVLKGWNYDLNKIYSTCNHEDHIMIYYAILWLNLQIATTYGSLCMCSIPWFEGLMFRLWLQISCRVLFSTDILGVLDECNLKNFRTIRTSKECARDPNSHLEHPIGSSSLKDRKIAKQKIQEMEKRNI